MKTKLLLFAVSTLFGLRLLAGNVTLEQAQKVALNFYFEKFNLFEGQVAPDQLRILSAYTETDGIENFYYVFRISQGGFVMVSADDRLNPVLGYSFKNDFGFENRPPNVRWWLQQYADQVKYVRDKQLVQGSQGAECWEYYLNDNFKITSAFKEGKAVEPLLTTTWDQGWPYNYYCPPTSSGGSGGHTYVGCVATAIAQILYYWRWPDHGQGYTSYLSTITPEYGVQFADFENTWYRFNEMVDYPQTVNLAIAEFSYHIAVAIQMNFGPGGSFPTTDDSLKYFFKLMPYTWYYRDNMPDDQWRQLLTESIDNKFPVYYSGNPSSGDGHAFVCDGYQDADYFHFNLGWGGQSNGYYTIDNIQGFNYDQSMVPNVCPDTIQFNYPLFCSGADTCCMFEGSFTDYSGPLQNYLNNTQASWLINPQTEFDSVTKIIVSVKRFDLFNDGDRLYIYDGENNSAPLLAELSGNTLPGAIESTGNKVFIEFITDGSNTAPGFYLNYKTIRPVWCSGVTQMTEPVATFDDGSGSFYYYNSSTCMWMIDPGITEPLTLHFNYFDTEENHDVLKVYDLVSQILLAEISGFYATPPEPVTAPGGKMMLAFLSSNSVQGQGWEVWYDINTGIPENTQEFELNIIPNPVTSKVKLSFSLPTDQQVSILIFDVVGKESLKILDEYLQEGQHNFEVDLENFNKEIYFCRVQIGNEMVTKKIVKL
jgi:hypothetical protein